MLEQILVAVYPHGFPPARVRRVWAVALLLSPLALVAGFLLLARATPPSPVPLTINYKKAIALARDFLAHKGVRVDNWDVSVSGNIDYKLLDFANAKRERKDLWKVAPPLSATVHFRENQDHAAQVDVGVDGRVLGFKSPDLTAPKVILNSAEALALASAQLPAGVTFANPVVENNPMSGRATYTFRSSSVPGAEIIAIVTLQGGQPRQLSVQAVPDEPEPQSAGKKIQAALIVPGALLVCLVVIFSVYRYIVRALQEEISFRRSVIVAAFFSGMCILIALNVIGSAPEGTVALYWLVYLALGIIGGAVMAAAYASGEGDVREAQPGKLTSLDAVLSGHLLSLNSGVSVLVGMACAGFLILAWGALAQLLDTSTPQGSVALITPLMRYSELQVAVFSPLMALIYAASGLLQPLAFLNQFLPGARRWHLPVLVLCSALISTAWISGNSPQDFLLQSVSYVTALLLPFFLMDLLATLVCLTATLMTYGFAAALTIMPGYTWPQLFVAIPVALAVVLLSLLSIRRGRFYTEEEVRPVYARYVVQRKALESEVLAAREAQLRLLPDCVPEFPGLQLAAACLPAETVGGDFYDFFPLRAGQLGVFMAEGNNGGIAAALTIAFAKGYLMHCVERFCEPVEVVAYLQAALAPIFSADEAKAEFAFAIIDLNTSELRYAKTALYPKIVVASKTGPPQPLNSTPGKSALIFEGWSSLAEGDYVLFFTDGLGRRLAKQGQPDERAASLVTRSNQKSGEPIDSVLDLLLGPATKSNHPDDLTLVVAHIDTAVPTSASLRVTA